jgi:hypothetical protein
MGRAEWEGYKEQKPKIEGMIREMHGNKQKWDIIADALNKAGLKTKSGLKWQGPSATAYSLNHKVVGRRISTSAGQAGSSGSSYVGKSKYSAYSGRAMNRVPQTRKRSGISDTEVEEIMTSNLATELKLKIVRIVALGSI